MDIVSLFIAFVILQGTAFHITDPMVLTTAAILEMPMSRRCSQLSGVKKIECIKILYWKWMGRLSHIMSNAGYEDIKFVDVEDIRKEFDGSIDDYDAISFALLNSGAVDMLFWRIEVTPETWYHLKMTYPFSFSRTVAFISAKPIDYGRLVPFSFIIKPFGYEFWLQILSMFIMIQVVRRTVTRFFFQRFPVVIPPIDSNKDNDNHTNNNNTKVAAKSRFLSWMLHSEMLLLFIFSTYYNLKLRSMATVAQTSVDAEIDSLAQRIRNGHLTLLTRQDPSLTRQQLNNSRHGRILLSALQHNSLRESREILENCRLVTESLNGLHQYMYIEAVEIDGFERAMFSYVVAPNATTLYNNLQYSVQHGIILSEDHRLMAARRKLCPLPGLTSQYLTMVDIVDACYVFCIGISLSIALLIVEAAVFRNCAHHAHRIIQIEGNVDKFCSQYLSRMKAVELDGFMRSMYSFVVAPNATAFYKILDYSAQHGIFYSEDYREREEQRKFCESLPGLTSQYISMVDIVDACYVFCIGISLSIALLIAEAAVCASCVWNLSAYVLTQ